VVVAASMTLRPTPCCADGDIHIIIVRSTSDPGLQKPGMYWQFRLEETLATGKTPRFQEYGVFGALESARIPGGLGRNDVRTWIVLKGEDARHSNIARVCEEVSQYAGPDDAIMVVMMSHGFAIKENDGVGHGMSPTATSPDDLEISRKGIMRGTILEKLKVKPHRLIALITDSCMTRLRNFDETDVTDLPDIPRPCESGIAAFPQDTCYLKKFLQEAHGEININSSDYGQAAWFVTKSKFDEFCGSLFINAFCRFAANGFYLESELNPDDFFKLLNAEYSRELLDYGAKTGESFQSSLTKFNGSQPISTSSPKFSNLNEFKAYYDARRELMSNAGEFAIADRTFPDAKANNANLGMKFVPITSDGSFDLGENLSFLCAVTREGRLEEAAKYRPGVKRSYIPREFWIAQSETTVGQFKAFVQATGYRTVAERGQGKSYDVKAHRDDSVNWRNPGFEQNDRHPVVAVTRSDAEAFCRWLSQKDGKKYRLPTEAEWEYCCRAGTNTRFWFGNDPDEAPGYENVSGYPWPDSPYQYDDPYEFTSPVRSFKSNMWNLYDMGGNVSEFCLDDELRDEYGPVTRGESWRYWSCRGSYAKEVLDYDESRPYVGFRVLMEAE
ncbi:MAG: SUMF1/EgtB/PvdO family nonheme iron enzyme, partial [Thermoguttaceae bacterium]|nr:SUMF1/EgtB/PvdO family nonheme iron enzyme [Thermoguttaceae bacterium]